MIGTFGALVTVQLVPVDARRNRSDQTRLRGRPGRHVGLCHRRRGELLVAGTAEGRPPRLKSLLRSCGGWFTLKKCGADLYGPCTSSVVGAGFACSVVGAGFALLVVGASFSRLGSVTIRHVEAHFRCGADLYGPRQVAPSGMPACGRRRCAPEIGFRSLSFR